MKKISVILSLVIAAAVMFNCQSGTQKTSDEEGSEAKESKAKKELTLDEKARNTYKNTLCVFSGSMVVLFSGAFGEMAEGIAESFNQLAAGEVNTDDIDAKIATMPENIMQKMDEMVHKMDSVFNGFKAQDEALYDKMFKHEVMQEGVDITTKYELPSGFRPLSENLTGDEIKRYIVKMAASSDETEDTEDPVVKTYQDLFVWFQKADEAFRADPEIAAFLKSIEKK